MINQIATEDLEPGAPMDYREHEQTYSGFIAFTKLSIVFTINVLLALVIFTFGSGGAFWVAVLVLILAIVAATMGIIVKGSWKPSGAVLGVAIVALILTVG